MKNTKKNKSLRETKGQFMHFNTEMEGFLGYTDGAGTNILQEGKR